jgi:hypothetical protein
LVFAFGSWCYFGDFLEFGKFPCGADIMHFFIVQIMISFGLDTRLPDAIFVLFDLSLLGLASVPIRYLNESRFLAGSS